MNIIKHLNSPNEAITHSGKRVVRQNKLWFNELRRFVNCAPYDNHFCYDNPDNSKAQWTPMCTCGSPAGIVGYNAYKTDSSPSDNGELVVCLSHAMRGTHADGSN